MCCYSSTIGDHSATLIGIYAKSDAVGFFLSVVIFAAWKEPPAIVWPTVWLSMHHVPPHAMEAEMGGLYDQHRKRRSIQVTPGLRYCGLLDLVSGHEGGRGGTFYIGNGLR